LPVGLQLFHPRFQLIDPRQQPLQGVVVHRLLLARLRPDRRYSTQGNHGNEHQPL
jgi:hypothetical protein